MTEDLDRPISGPFMRVVRHWDTQAFETDDFTPIGALAAIILWKGFPDVDGGVPQRLVRPLAAALTELGEVCFRIGDGAPANARVLGAVKNTRKLFAPSWEIVGTHDAVAAEALFESGWAQGDQIAIIAPADEGRATTMLAAKHLTRFALAGTELITAAIVDGAGMLVAAQDRGRLEDAIASISRHCAENGVPRARD